MEVFVRLVFGICVSRSHWTANIRFKRHFQLRLWLFRQWMRYSALTVATDIFELPWAKTFAFDSCTGKHFSNTLVSNFCLSRFSAKKFVLMSLHLNRIYAIDQKNKHQIYIFWNRFHFMQTEAMFPMLLLINWFIVTHFRLKCSTWKKQTNKKLLRKKHFDEKGTMKKDYGQDSKSFSSVVNGHSLRPSFDMRASLLYVLLLLVIFLCMCVCSVQHFSRLANWRLENRPRLTETVLWLCESSFQFNWWKIDIWQFTWCFLAKFV